MSEFEREDQQVMDVVNGHGTPEAERAAEEIAREVTKKQGQARGDCDNPSVTAHGGDSSLCTREPVGRNGEAAWGMDCAPCDAGGYGYNQTEQPQTASWEDLQQEDPYTCGMSAKALRQERWYHFRCRMKALWRLILIELLGYAALGGVLVAGMALDVVPMGVAVPVFVACFMWVAVRLDRWARG